MATLAYLGYQPAKESSVELPGGQFSVPPQARVYGGEHIAKVLDVPAAWTQVNNAPRGFGSAPMMDNGDRNQWHYVSGVYLDEGGLPAVRKIRVVDRASGKILGLGSTEGATVPTQPLLWDQAYAPSPFVLSDSNRRLTLPTGNSSIAKTARSNVGKSSGKWYFEIKFIDILTNDTVTGAGIAAGSFSFVSANMAGGTAGNTAVGVWPDSSSTQSRVYRGGGYTNLSAGVPELDDNRVLMMAFDIDALNLWIGVDGVWHGGVDPGAGLSPTVDSTYLAAGQTWYPAASPWSGLAVLDIGTSFYTPPAGFSRWVDTAPSTNAGGYLVRLPQTGEVIVMCLDDDADPLRNDLVLRTFPVGP